MKCNSFLLLYLFSFLLWCNYSNAMMQVEVYSCGTYSIPNVNYIQMVDLQNIDAESSVCILINGSHSIYNGNGKNISSTNKHGVRIEGENITVTNSHIVSCSVGISLVASRSYAFNNEINGCTKTGIMAAGQQANIYSNSVLNIVGTSAEGIIVTGSNSIINNNRVEGIKGIPAVGILYSAVGYVQIANNIVSRVTPPSGIYGCSGSSLDVLFSGITVNVTQSVDIQRNIISEIGGGGCTNSVKVKALTIYTSSASSAYPPVVVNNNTIFGIQGSGLVGNAAGVSCKQLHQDKPYFQVQVTNSKIVNISVYNAEAVGIDSDGCSVICENNIIENLNGANTYGIRGVQFSSFAILENTISYLSGRDTSRGIVVTLKEAGSGGLRVLNNQMGPEIDEDYYFQSSIWFSDVCGGETEYRTSNSSCFPPGDNCCRVDCTRPCTICDASCGSIAPGNCIDCNYTCGNGICDSGENCTNCSADCACDVVCGDEICDHVQGESCSTCTSDCGTCGPVCPRNCTGRGLCVETNICECYGNYSGSDCSKLTIDFDYNIDTVYPGTSITYNIKDTVYSYNISITEIREVTKNGSLVKSIPISSDMFEPVPLNFYTLYLFLDTSGLIQNIYAELPNGAKMLFTLFTIPERKVFSFGKSNINVAPKSVKFNVQIWDWPFLSIFNQLEVYSDHFPTIGSEVHNITYVRDIFGNIRSQEIITPQRTSLFVKVFPYAIADGFLRRMKVRETSKGVVMSLPFFLTRAIYDPDFSVLLNLEEEEDNGGGNEETSGNSNNGKSGNDLNVVGIVVGIVVSVSIVIFIAVAVKVLYPRWQERRAIGGAKKRQSKEKNIY